MTYIYLYVYISLTHLSLAGVRDLPLAYGGHEHVPPAHAGRDREHRIDARKHRGQHEDDPEPRRDRQPRQVMAQRGEDMPRSQVLLRIHLLKLETRESLRHLEPPRKEKNSQRRA